MSDSSIEPTVNDEVVFVPATVDESLPLVDGNVSDVANDDGYSSSTEFESKDYLPKGKPKKIRAFADSLQRNARKRNLVRAKREKERKAESEKLTLESVMMDDSNVMMYGKFRGKTWRAAWDQDPAYFVDYYLRESIKHSRDNGRAPWPAVEVAYNALKKM